MALGRTIKNILVAVDLSKYSQTVVQQARVLAKKINAPLTFVYAFKDTEMFESPFGVRKAEVIKYYDQLIRQKYALDESIPVVVKFGKPYKQIIAAAKNLKFPLIVAGHRGQSTWTQFFVGSAAEQLGLESPYPVWIHRGESLIVPEKILIPCDLSERSHHAVHQVQPFLRAFKAKSELYHVVPQPLPILDFQSYVQFSEKIKRSEAQKRKAFKKKHPQLKIVDSEGGVVEQIQKRLENFDLLAISPKTSLKAKPFFGSVTSKLLRSGDKPILIAP